MKPKKLERSGSEDLFRARLENIIDLRHPRRTLLCLISIHAGMHRKESPISEHSLRRDDVDRIGPVSLLIALSVTAAFVPEAQLLLQFRRLGRLRRADLAPERQLNPDAMIVVDAKEGDEDCPKHEAGGEGHLLNVHCAAVMFRVPPAVPRSQRNDALVGRRPLRTLLLVCLSLVQNFVACLALDVVLLPMADGDN